MKKVLSLFVIYIFFKCLCILLSKTGGGGGGEWRGLRHALIWLYSKFIAVDLCFKEFVAYNLMVFHLIKTRIVNILGAQKVSTL